MFSFAQSDSPSSFFWFSGKVLSHFRWCHLNHHSCATCVLSPHQAKSWDSGWSNRADTLDNQNVICDRHMKIGREKVLFCWCCQSETVWFWDSRQPSCHHVVRAHLQNTAKQRRRAEGTGRTMMTSRDMPPSVSPPLQDSAYLKLDLQLDFLVLKANYILFWLGLFKLEKLSSSSKISAQYTSNSSGDSAPLTISWCCPRSKTARKHLKGGGEQRSWSFPL